MNRLGIWVVICSGILQSAEQPLPDAPRFNSANRLLRPADYRNWIYLSSSLGLQYSPGAAPSSPSFENVYVNPSAFRAFEKDGKWPDGTIFALEIRQSMDGGTFAVGGRYQGDFVRLEAAVKDGGRFPEKWAYFDLGATAESAPAFPKTERCFVCHAANAAVENSFAQFYPAVFSIAKQRGTVNPGYGSARQTLEQTHTAPAK